MRPIEVVRRHYEAREDPAIDVLVATGDHVIACGHGLEVWTVREGQVVRHREYTLDEGLQVLADTTGSDRLSALCRDLAAFNRGSTLGWPAAVAGARPESRLDDVELLADGPGMLALSARRSPGGNTLLHLVIAFDGDGTVQRVSGHPTAAGAMAGAAAVFS